MGIFYSRIANGATRNFAQVGDGGGAVDDGFVQQAFVMLAPDRVSRKPGTLGSAAIWREVITA